MASRSESTGDPDPQGIGVKTQLPDFKDSTSAKDGYRSWIAPSVARTDTAKNLAAVGLAISQHTHAIGPPRSATDLDAFTGGELATDVLGRAAWDHETLAYDSAIRVVRSTPDSLLLDSQQVRRTQNSHTIYGAIAVFEHGPGLKLSPLVTTRSFGDDIAPSTDDAIHAVVHQTSRLVISSQTTAPIVCGDLGVADHAAERLMSDEIAFALAIGPEWYRPDVATLDSVSVLYGRSPAEVFIIRGDHITAVPQSDSTRVEVVRLRHQGIGTADLMYARIAADGEQRFYLVRPPADPSASTYRRLSAAARLAITADRLRGTRPLESFGLDAFYASENEAKRFAKYEAIVQSLTGWACCEPDVQP